MEGSNVKTGSRVWRTIVVGTYRVRINHNHECSVWYKLEVHSVCTKIRVCEYLEEIMGRIIQISGYVVG